MKFDFSQFHPLDHWPYSPRCHEFYGGGRHHLRLAWDIRRRDEVIGVFARFTTCLIGNHKWRVWKRGRGPLSAVIGQNRVLGEPGDYFAACAYCDARRTATEDEWW